MHSFKFKKIALLLVVLMLIIFIVLRFAVSKDADEQESVNSVAVGVYVVNDVAVTETIVLPGTTQSAERTVLRFQVSGRVKDKKVRLGEPVKKGDALVVLDNPEIQPLAAQATQNVQRLQTVLSQAKREFARMNILYKEQAVTKQEWETRKTAEKSAQEAVNAAIAAQERTSRLAQELTLIAPFDGVITDISVDHGDVVQAGSQAMSISNPDVLELKLTLSDQMIAKLSPGQVVRVKPALGGDRALFINGKIHDISPFRGQGALPQVVVSLPVSAIKPGVAVSAELDVVSDAGLNIPLKAIVMTGQNSSAVYVLKKDQVQLLPIRPIKISSASVLVDSGLSVGDRIVVAGMSQLYDGATVSVVEQNGIDETTSQRPEQSTQGAASEAMNKAKNKERHSNTSGAQ